VHVVICFFVFGCQYQCSRLPGKCDVKPYTLTHSVATWSY